MRSLPFLWQSRQYLCKSAARVLQASCQPVDDARLVPETCGDAQRANVNSLFMNMHGRFRYADAHACKKKKRTHVLKPVHARVFILSIFRLDFVLVCNFKTNVEVENEKNTKYCRSVKIRKLISSTMHFYMN